MQQEAFNHYKKNTMSIEVLKDDCLQKINFRVKNKVTSLESCWLLDLPLMPERCVYLGTAICREGGIVDCDDLPAECAARRGKGEDDVEC